MSDPSMLNPTALNPTALNPTALWLLLLTPAVVWAWRRQRVRALLRTLLFVALVLAIARIAIPRMLPTEQTIWVTCDGDPPQLELHNPSADSADSTSIVSCQPSQLSRTLLELERSLAAESSTRIIVRAPQLGLGPIGAEVATRLRSRGIPLHADIVGDAPLQLVTLQAPTTVRVGFPTTLQLQLRAIPGAIRGAIPQQQRGLGIALELLIEDSDAGSNSTPWRRVAQSHSDDNGYCEFKWTPQRPGFERLAVRRLLSDDAAPLLGSRWVAVQEPRIVAYKGARPPPTTAGLQGFSFRSIDATTDCAELCKRCDLLWIDDHPAFDWGPQQLQDISQGVRDNGCGLLLSGCEGAYLIGGYGRTPLAPLLPIEIPESEVREDPSTTLVVIIDTSSSMTGERFQLAKEVARLALRRLLPHDRAGIVEFYGAKRWAAPIQPASHHVDLQRALNRLTAAGGTVVLPALEEAYYALQSIQTRTKHVLVITDGGVEQAPFEPWVRRMAEANITLSTVLIGEATHSDFLLRLAQWGGGRFTRVPDRFRIPELLLKDPSSDRPTPLRPGPFALRWHFDPSDDETHRMRLSRLPSIPRRIEASAKPGAHTRVSALYPSQAAPNSEGTAAGAPLITRWNVNSSTVTCVTTDLRPQQWASSADATYALASLLQQCARSEQQWGVSSDIWGTQTRIRIDGAPLSVFEPDDLSSQCRLRHYDSSELLPRGRRIAPQQLEFALHSPEALQLLELVEVAGLPQKQPRLLSRYVAQPQLPAAPPTLSDLVEFTGGSHYDPTVELAASPPHPSWQELRPYAFLVALLLYLADVVWRRLPATPRGRSFR